MQESNWKYSINCRVPSGSSLPKGVRRYAAIVSYDGTSYCGFQKQKHSPSIQEALEYALSFVADEPVIVSCAGRTDTGVHASYQVIHFDASVDRNGRNWVMGGNSKLPDSIALIWASKVDESFHARFSAMARTYRYVMVGLETRPAILSSGITWVKGELDINAMQSACEHLLGEKDFSAFRGSGCQSLSPNRNVHDATLFKSGQLVVFNVTANAFVLHMVRNVVGSLIEVGLHRKEPTWIGELLDGRNRCKSAATALPNGLYLANVGYPEYYKFPEIPLGPFFLNFESGGGI